MVRHAHAAAEHRDHDHRHQREQHQPLAARRGRLGDRPLGRRRVDVGRHRRMPIAASTAAAKPEGSQRAAGSPAPPPVPVRWRAGERRATPGDLDHLDVPAGERRRASGIERGGGEEHPGHAGSIGEQRQVEPVADGRRGAPHQGHGDVVVGHAVIHVQRCLLGEPAAGRPIVHRLVDAVREEDGGDPGLGQCRQGIDECGGGPIGVERGDRVGGVAHADDGVGLLDVDAPIAEPAGERCARRGLGGAGHVGDLGHDRTRCSELDRERRRPGAISHGHPGAGPEQPTGEPAVQAPVERADGAGLEQHRHPEHVGRVDLGQPGQQLPEAEVARQPPRTGGDQDRRIGQRAQEGGVGQIARRPPVAHPPGVEVQGHEATQGQDRRSRSSSVQHGDGTVGRRDPEAHRGVDRRGRQEGDLDVGQLGGEASEHGPDDEVVAQVAERREPAGDDGSTSTGRA